MSAKGIYVVTEIFEKAICDYTNSPYCVAVDSCSNAMFLALMRYGVKDMEIEIPSRTYMSVPCSIIHAGAKVKFRQVIGTTLKGAYTLYPTNIIDSSLRFTADMYEPGTTMCLSFTGPYKHLKLGKGGAILCDNKEDYIWYKKARFSGRNEVPYSEDNFDQLGWNFYILPEIAARGCVLMQQFYYLKGNKKNMEDIEHAYPDLSKYSIYTK